MVSMKRTDEEKAAEAKRWEDGPRGQDTLPWGLEISLEEPELAKLGNPALEVGSTVTLSGVAVVESRSEEEEGGQPRKRVRLQITDMTLNVGRTDADRAQALYGGTDGKA